MDDPYLWQRNHQIAVELYSWGEFRDGTPVLDELGKHFGDVRTRRVYPAPETGSTTMPDWAEIASLVTLWFIAVGPTEFVRKIVGSLAEDAYQDLRDRLRTFRRRRFERFRSRELGRVKQGITIRVGSHHFVFDQSISDAEFKRQLRAAQEIVQKSPSYLLLNDDPDDEWRPWLWDKRKRKWHTAGVRLADAVGEEPRTFDD